MKKRIVSLVLVAAMMFSMISAMGIPAFAASTEPFAESTAALAVEGTWGNPGETVDVNLVLTENPGILGATFTVSWGDGLTLEADASGEAFAELTYQRPSRYVAAGTNFVWYGNEVGEVADGTILTLTFRVSETVENNDILPIRVTYTYGDIIDGNDNDVAVDITDGYVRVLTYKPGDTNGDGRVNARDLVNMSQYISDGNMTDPEGYNAVVDEDACDVTGDGRINARDLILLSQYISDGGTVADGYNAKLQPAKMPECSHPNMQAHAAIEATCTEDGNIAYWSCADCAKYFSDAQGTTEISLSDIVVGATGHNYSDWATTKNATCTETGNQERICGNCGDVESETIEMDENNHPQESLETIPGYDATFDSKGLTDGTKCNACQKIVKEQTETPAGKENSIKVVYWYNYDNLKEEVIYSKNSSEYAIVPEERLGYEFRGWYRDGSDSPTTAIIPSQAAENGVLDLFARWDDIEFTITYKGTKKPNNPTTYTINKGFTLATPEWAGLAFSHWTDEGGNVITAIEKGRTGDITLTAHWRSVRNMAIVNNDESFDVTYDEVLEQYYFIYPLGEVKNVVLNTHFLEKFDGTKAITYTEEKTVSVEEGVATSVTNEIFQSITQTNDWLSATEEIEHESKTTKKEFTICPQLEISKVKLKAWGYTNGSTNVDEKTLVETKQTYESTKDQHDASTAISSTVSYVVDTSTTVKHIIDLNPAYSPVGEYSYVYAGDVMVFAVVTYDPATGDYYMDAYSVMYRTFTTTIYELMPEFDLDVDIVPNELFSFNIPIADMVAYVDSSYYVRYDANGGTYVPGAEDQRPEGQKTAMPLQSIARGTEEALMPNQYIKEGYSFGGWKLEGKVEPIQDQQRVSDLANAGETITLTAIWIPVPYSASWSNGEHYSVKVERVSSPDVGAQPGSLQSGATVYVNDVLKISFVAAEGYSVGEGEKIYTVRAKDSDVSAGRIPQSVFETTAVANTYTIVYNNNGGSGSMNNTSCTYDASTTLHVNSFTRHGWIFIGWKDQFGRDYTDGQSVKNLTADMNGTVTLYAQWELITSATYTYSFTQTVTDDEYSCCEQTLADKLDLNYLINNGYRFYVHSGFHIKELDQGIQEFVICVNPVEVGWTLTFTGTLYRNQDIEIVSGGKYEMDFTCITDTVSSANLSTHNSLYFYFSANGGLEDDWQISNFWFTIYFE